MYFGSVFFMAFGFIVQQTYLALSWVFCLVTWFAPYDWTRWRFTPFVLFFASILRCTRPSSFITANRCIPEWESYLVLFGCLVTPPFPSTLYWNKGLFPATCDDCKPLTRVESIVCLTKTMFGLKLFRTAFWAIVLSPYTKQMTLVVSTPF